MSKANVDVTINLSCTFGHEAGELSIAWLCIFKMVDGIAPQIEKVFLACRGTMTTQSVFRKDEDTGSSSWQLQLTVKSDVHNLHNGNVCVSC